MEFVRRAWRGLQAGFGCYICRSIDCGGPAGGCTCTCHGVRKISIR